MNTRQKVATRILEYCRDQHLSPFRLAELSGVPASTVKSILNGQSRNPGVVTIAKICGGLGISVSEFFDADEFAGICSESDI